MYEALHPLQLNLYTVLETKFNGVVDLYFEKSIIFCDLEKTLMLIKFEILQIFFFKNFKTF